MINFSKDKRKNISSWKDCPVCHKEFRTFTAKVCPQCSRKARDGDGKVEFLLEEDKGEL